MRSLIIAVAAAGLVAVGAGTASAGTAGTPTTAGSPTGAFAAAKAVNSPGVLSGNVFQMPIHIPVNLCGNSLDLIGLVNPAGGNLCVNR